MIMMMLLVVASDVSHIDVYHGLLYRYHYDTYINFTFIYMEIKNILSYDIIGIDFLYIDLMVYLTFTNFNYR